MNRHVKVPTHCGGKDESGSSDVAFSSRPVRYFNGAIRYAVEDLSLNAFGNALGHTRSYGNQMFEGSPGSNGNGWFLELSPVLLFDADGSVGMVGHVHQPHWFAPEADGYKALLGDATALERDDANQQYIVTDREGVKTHFFGEGSPYKGAFKGRVDRNGAVTLAAYNSRQQMESFVTTSGSQTAGFHFEYYHGSGGSTADQYKVVTSRVNGQDVRRARYEYHGRGESGGAQGDLKSALVEQYDPATGAWFEVAKSHYRYYTTFASPGFPSGLKYIVGPEAYSRMVAAGLQPETASDSQLAEYADFYFEYDIYQRVTHEAVNGGAYTHLFSYAESGNPDDFNTWAVKTVETLPDGNRNVAYSNYAGQVILKSFQEGDGEHFTYFQFDHEGKGVLRAESSAVAGYDENQPGLVTLHENKGLIHTYEYYTNPADAGYAPGYLKHEGVQTRISQMNFQVSAGQI